VKRQKKEPAGRRAESPATGQFPLRIIGGTYARRLLKYAGDPRTRPMKDRVREAVFNLVGPAVVGKHAVDLFAGTGALGLEAISRGALRATFIEQHFPTAAVIRENIAALDVGAVTEVIAGNAFIWSRRRLDLGSAPWLVFCSPPYDFYASRATDILDMLTRLFATAPPESIFVVEADRRFDFAKLAEPGDWDVREYPPARVGIRRTGAMSDKR
jgi:16S rRNA (guanine966-N2)-methyltransferase